MSHSSGIISSLLASVRSLSAAKNGCDPSAQIEISMVKSIRSSEANLLENEVINIIYNLHK